MGKAGILRPKSERRRRFALLPLAKEILIDPHACIINERKMITHHSKINGVRVANVIEAHFSTFRKAYKGKAVIMVVRKIDDRAWHFLSIFEKTKKTAQ